MSNHCILKTFFRFFVALSVKRVDRVEIEMQTCLRKRKIRREIMAKKYHLWFLAGLCIYSSVYADANSSNDVLLGMTGHFYDRDVQILEIPLEHSENQEFDVLKLTARGGDLIIHRVEIVTKENEEIEYEEEPIEGGVLRKGRTHKIKIAPSLSLDRIEYISIEASSSRDRYLGRLAVHVSKLVTVECRFNGGNNQPYSLQTHQFIGKPGYGFRDASDCDRAARSSRQSVVCNWDGSGYVPYRVDGRGNVGRDNFGFGRNDLDGCNQAVMAGRNGFMCNWSGNNYGIYVIESNFAVGKEGFGYRTSADCNPVVKESRNQYICHYDGRGDDNVELWGVFSRSEPSVVIRRYTDYRNCVVSLR